MSDLSSLIADIEPEFDAALARSERFSTKFTAGDTYECWEWCGTRKRGTSGYYGVFYLGKTRRISAHRAAYMIHNKVDPAEKCVCHACDNPLCVNPRHLWLGTVADNNRDRSAKGRTAPPSEAFKFHGKTSGENHGSAKLTEVDVAQILVRRSNGESLRSIAAGTSVTFPTIHKIVSGKLWRGIHTTNATLRALQQKG